MPTIYVFAEYVASGATACISKALINPLEQERREINGWLNKVTPLLPLPLIGFVDAWFYGQILIQVRSHENNKLKLLGSLDIAYENHKQS